MNKYRFVPPVGRQGEIPTHPAYISQAEPAKIVPVRACERNKPDIGYLKLQFILLCKVDLHAESIKQLEFHPLRSLSDPLGPSRISPKISDPGG